MILFSSQISCQWEVKSTKLHIVHIVKIKKMSTVQRPTRSRSLTSAWKPNKKMSAPPGRRSFSCGAKQNIPSACVHTKPFLQQISTKISWRSGNTFPSTNFNQNILGVYVKLFLRPIVKSCCQFFPSKFSLWQSLSADVDVCPCEIVGLMEEISNSHPIVKSGHLCHLTVSWLCEIVGVGWMEEVWQCILMCSHVTWSSSFVFVQPPYSSQ